VSRRIIPFILLGALTAGAGLGAALGLTRGPNTVDPAPTAHAALSICENRFLSKPIYVARGSRATERSEEARTLNRQVQQFSECLQYEGYGGPFGWVAYAPMPKPR
jgi:hypothetical protein